MPVKNKFLVVGGIIAGLTAVWHLLCIAGGPGWYAFARAPRAVVESARQGTLFAPVGAIVLATLFFACTAYALSGAGIIKKLPFLQSALVTISVICLVRALVVVPALLAGRLGMWHIVTGIGWFFSGVCFGMGALQQLKK